MEKQNICSYHYKIFDKANEILKIKNNDYDNIDDLLSEVQNIANDILNLSEDARKAGQSMEDRLKDYRDAIEGLGFIRKK